MNWQRCSVAVIGLLALPSWAGADTPGYPEQVIQWTVRAGESCEDISKAVYGSTKHKRLVLRYNQVACVPGAPLTEGMTLVLPASTKEVAPAKLSSVKQETVTKSSGGAWAAAQAGQALQTNASVNTRGSGRAGIVFSDQSKIFLAENTLVVIFGTASQSSVGSTDALPTVELSEGELQAGIAALRGGSARVAVEGGGSVSAESKDVVIKRQSGRTHVSVFDGKASVGSGSQVISVPKDFGTKFETGKAPDAPRPLPPAPIWDAAGDRIVLGEDTGTLSVGWNPVANTKFYRVQVAKDPEFAELVVSEQVNASILSFRGEGFAPGTYHLRVRAIDTEDFLGVATAPRSVSLAGLSLSKGARLTASGVAVHPYSEVSLQPNASLEVSANGVDWQPFKGRIDPTNLTERTLLVRTRAEPSTTRALVFEPMNLGFQGAREARTARLVIPADAEVRLDDDVRLSARVAGMKTQLPIQFAPDGLSASVAPAADESVEWYDGSGRRLGVSDPTEFKPEAAAVVVAEPVPWRGPTFGLVGLASTDGFSLLPARPRSMAFLSLGASGVSADPRLRFVTGARGVLGPVGIEAQVSSAELLNGAALDETAWLGASAHLHDDDRALQLGAGLRVGLPLSATAPALRLEPVVAVGGEVDAFSWIVDLGARFRLATDAGRFPTDEGQGFIVAVAAYDPIDLLSVFGLVDMRLATPETTEPFAFRGGLGAGVEAGTWIFGSASVRASPWADDVGHVSGTIAIGVREPPRSSP